VPHEGQQELHERADRERHGAQQAVEGIVTAAGQEARDACLRRAVIQQEQPVTYRAINTAKVGVPSVLTPSCCRHRST